MAAGRLVALNDRGLRVGETHQNARLTNHEIDLIHELHDGGMSYGALAEKFECSKSAIADVCKFRRRGQTAVKWKTLPDE